MTKTDSQWYFAETRAVLNKEARAISGPRILGELSCRQVQCRYFKGCSYNRMIVPDHEVQATNYANKSAVSFTPHSPSPVRR